MWQFKLRTLQYGSAYDSLVANSRSAESFCLEERLRHSSPKPGPLSPAVPFEWLINSLQGDKQALRTSSSMSLASKN